MKKHIILTAVVSTLIIRVSAFGQGALTPSGPPGQTMRTLLQVEPRTPISSLPYVISQPGSYFLTTNLTGVSGTNGITIVTNNVSIDLRGFTMTGVPGALDGISVIANLSNLGQNIVAKNGTITEWPGNGVEADATDNSQFSDLNLYNNTFDGLNPGQYAEVRHCIAANNGLEGFGGVLDQYCIFEDCIAYNSGDAGFTTAANCSFQDCNAYSDGDAGFRAGYTSSFEDCIAAEDGTGFDVQNASCIFEHCNCQLDGTGFVTGDNCTLRDSTAYYCGEDGIDAGQACVLEGCTASENSNGGINVSNDCTLTGCVAATNEMDNIITVAGCVLSQCVANGSTAGNGIAPGPANTITGCNASGNAGAGIYVTNAPGCRIEGNTLDLNNAAMVVAQNNRAFILRNSADANVATNFVFGSGNSWGPIVNVSGAGDISTIANSSHPDANFIH
jgi:parallel beta-helix repeat protein